MLDSSFAVSDHFTPSGALGDGTTGNVTTRINAQCKERPPNAEGDCYRFDYQVGGNHWAGAYWLYPSNNWGVVPGRELERSAFRHVRFSAAVLEGNEQVVFFIGGVDGRNAQPPQPYFDPFKADTSLTVTTDWQSFSLAIPSATPGADPQAGLIGAFGWSMSFEATEMPASKTLFLDDIVYE